MESGTSCNCMCWGNVFLQRKAVLFCCDSDLGIGSTNRNDPARRGRFRGEEGGRGGVLQLHSLIQHRKTFLAHANVSLPPHMVTSQRQAPEMVLSAAPQIHSPRCQLALKLWEWSWKALEL